MNQNNATDWKAIGENFQAGLEKGSEQTEGESKGWFRNIKSKVAQFGAEKAAGSIGEEIGRNPRGEIIQPMQEATTAYIQDETGEEVKSAKEYIFSAVKINPETDNLWTRIKKSFFKVALSFGSFVTAFVGINYASKKLGFEHNTNDRKWIQMILAIFGVGIVNEYFEAETGKKRDKAQNTANRTQQNTHASHNLAPMPV